MRDFEGVVEKQSSKIYSEEELIKMSHDELLIYRGVIEEKLAHMREQNDSGNDLLVEMEKYYRKLKDIIKEKEGQS